ncbi:MAG: YifB family Mg chelatase-like AAA ATPase [Cytophagales bacterium]|jgi:magnesium chelatase family protein|nr:YifB family Mg chelatase-like AAA ATPase [Cytophagales bacterium]
MITITNGATIYGVDAKKISIEINIVQGTNLYVVGLPDNAIKESQHRIESVLKFIKCEMPRQRVIVNLAPADIRKEGASYDLPIALAILNSSHQYHLLDLDKCMILGELALNGSLRPIKGALPIAILVKENNLKCFLLPKENAQEAAIVQGIDVIPISHISEAINFLTKKITIEPVRPESFEKINGEINKYELDFADVQGQENTKRALEIAAAGGHNLIMIGPPGGGKTMIAKRIPSILPPLTLDEALETTKIYSVMGKLQNGFLIKQRPFQSPHHTISNIALVGGGSNPQPGEISLANNGVLFLDELPEFTRSALEVMRQPLEERKVIISRSKVSVEFPANFMLIASMNPCPCGYYNHPTKKCVCQPSNVQKYMNKISGPLLDRIDLHIEVTPVSFEEISSKRKSESSKDIQKRVMAARNIQIQRFEKFKNIYTNAMMPSAMVHDVCILAETGNKLLKTAMEKLGLSARAYDRILRVARTIADLDCCENIKENHIAEAIRYRSLDRNSWGM